MWFLMVLACARRRLHRRKPLLYPSELRGHGRATLVHRFDLREAALALDEGRLASLATELATVHPTFRTG